ncbi:UDP-N-acetylglucosamine 2-epimerase (non-hydrolyzing) [Flavobacterium zhairuonense]|uniref:non-hydrolyzing UDP-N-acetylglucosamine 2-epimerase n=1 Tax=Flavobacterium zhairuonense TaxID=2493631 RepID=UPI00104D768D|nr:UDP-N-acetylglucosamine 2-epimerase (non-hydrolyzing) [Flavobacterium zhairuonense]KAF2510810.1 UDP-N-acetylglucosamine 2-epimerase (non-hydrolyzing) [Flavobacterium zhairuonense]
MEIDIIAGARPNFIKIASIISAIKDLKNSEIKYRLIHTGQHYDANMSGTFFEQLNIPLPDHNLEVGGGSQAEQTAAIMVRYEKLLNESFRPNICLVVGDVNSTMACSIVAAKMGVKVAHVEAGIRSNDWSMPEEINRIVTDSITSYFFTTSVTANKNLIAQGVASEKIFFVGNTMIDTLEKFKLKFVKPDFWDSINLNAGNYLLLTIHRPSNVDDDEKIKGYLEQILANSNNLPVVFPVHPRTQKVIDKLGIDHKNLYLVQPMGYLQFNYLVKNAKAVITDSGGITEETTVMGIPCITLRDNTERPETITVGTNELIGTNPNAIKPILEKLFAGNWKKGTIPELWDGKTAERIIDIIRKN